MTGNPLRSFVLLGQLCALAVFALVARAAYCAELRVTGPVVHDNLAIYFVHGASGGEDPLTLQEALASGKARVDETKNVNELSVENLSDRDLFIQAGDIVKGGQQDRVLSVSLLLPPRSGVVPIQSFCVESGRWTARGKEDSKLFTSASAAIPSREAKVAMRANATSYAAAGTAGSAQPARSVETGERQQEIWARVKKIQDKLSDRVGSPVTAAASPSSLQLTLENEKVKAAQQAYVATLKPAGEKSDDIVGYVFAINGRINSADLYPSHSLFKKMWPKLIEANATEAVGEKGAAAGTPPSLDEVRAFLTAAEQGKAQETALPRNVVLSTRDSDQAMMSETRRADGAWVHRSYLAKQ